MSDYLQRYTCKICKKNYTRLSSLWNYNKKFHKDNIQKQKLCKESYKKIFLCRQSKFKHKNIFCKSKNNILESKQQNNTNIQINTINNNNQKQIIINQIGKESVSCLPIKDILKIIGRWL